MKRPIRFFVISLSILMIAQHSPAPIVEEEKPTPAPEQFEAPKPKTKRPAKSAAASEERVPAKTETRAKAAPPPALQGPGRFGGTWTGHIDLRNPTIGGDQSCTVTVNATETSVSGTFGKAGPFNNVAVRKSGNTVTWHYGWFGEYTCTLTVSNDHRTAVYTLTSPFWGSGSSTLTRK